MKRRKFLISGTLLMQGVCRGMGVSFVPSVEMSIPSQLLETMAAVLEHMFPEGSVIPSAKSMQLIAFAHQTLMHPSYDKDIRDFVINGTKILHARAKGKFVSMDLSSKEEILREYEESDGGRQWLQRMMILGMEGLFGDPLYGSNIHQSGWIAIGTSGGEPRPQTRYIQP